MIVLHRPKTKTLTHKTIDRFHRLHIIMFVITLELMLWPIFANADHQQQRNPRLRADYPEIYQDDSPIYNEGYVLEDISMQSSELNPNPTSEPFSDFESYFINRAKDGEKYEITPNTPKRKSGLKHHRHRHRGRKNQQQTSPSFESYFKPESLNEAEILDEELNFLYEDAEEDSVTNSDEHINTSEQPQTNFNKTKPEPKKHHHHGKHIKVVDNWPYSELIFEPSPQQLMSQLDMITPMPAKVQPPWPVKKEAVVEGEVNLGGLMMVHSREDMFTCGPIMPQGGIQALEAMLFTLDIVNKKLKLIPNVTIGAHILDDCDKDTYGLEMAVDFIKGESPVSVLNCRS